jgi:peptide/nickel transport system substrate-binding protein
MDDEDERDSTITRRRFVTWAGAGFTAIGAPSLLAACGSASKSSSSIRRQQVVVAVSGGPAYLDPNIDISGTDWVALANIYDGLYMLDYSSGSTPAKIIPGLATKYSLSSDGRSYTFTLRDGVEFHDGSPWNADAAVFNFRRWFDKSFQYYYPRANATVVTYVPDVESYEAVDPRTFRVTLTQPNGGWLDYLAARGSTSFMVSPAAIKKYGNNGISNHGVGTGPYQVVDYQRDSRLVLEANPKYWGGAPGVKRLVLIPVTDDATRLSGLLSGQYDIAQELAPNTITQVQGNPQFKVEYALKPVTFGFAGSMRSGAWSDPLVRQAVSLAIDREGIAKTVQYGAAVPATQFYAPGNAAYDPTLPIQDPYDPKLAASLLKKSSYAKGLHLAFRTSTSAMGVPTPSHTLEAVQSNLQAIGISSSIDVSDWTTYLGFWLKGTPPGTGNNVPIYTMAMGADANMLLEQYALGANFPPKGTDFAWYSAPAATNQFGKIQGARSVPELIADLRAGQKIFLKERPYIFIYHGRSAFGLKKDVNWTPSSTWPQRFSAVSG